MWDRHHRIEIIVMIMAACGLPASSTFAQKHADGPDSGSGTAVAAFLGAVADMNDALAVETTMAEWTAREQRILGRMRLGLNDNERAASELYALARAYWNQANRAAGPRQETEFQYQEANRLLEKSIDLSPDSYAAAKSWMLVANTFFGNKSAPERSIEPFEKADQLLKNLIDKSDPGDQRARDELFKSRGIVTSRLAHAHLYTNQDEEAFQYFKTLVESPEMTENLLPGFLWNANRQLMRLAADREDVEESRQYYSALEEMVASGQVDADRAIRLRLEAIRKWWPDPFNEERIAALEKLWKEPKYQSNQRIVWAGDELAWAYFFSQPIARDKFAETSEKLLKQVRPHMKGLNESNFSALDGIYARNLLLAAEFARMDGETEQLEKLTEEFMTTYKNRDIEISGKADPDRERLFQCLRRLDQMYRQNMSAHYEAAQNRLRASEERRELLPTEAR